MRTRHPAAAQRSRSRAESPTTSSPPLRPGSRRRPIGRICARPRRISATHRARTRVPERLRSRRAGHLRRAGDVDAEPVGALGQLDDRERRERVERRRGAGSPSASTPATSTSSWARLPVGRQRRFGCSSTAALPATPTGSTSTRRATARSRSSGSTSSSAGEGPIDDCTLEIRFHAAGAEAYVFTSASGGSGLRSSGPTE